MTASAQSQRFSRPPNANPRRKRFPAKEKVLSLFLWNQFSMNGHVHDQLVSAEPPNLGLHNIELSSAADRDHRHRFHTGLNLQFQPAFQATAPTICYTALFSISQWTA